MVRGASFGNACYQLGGLFQLRNCFGEFADLFIRERQLYACWKVHGANLQSNLALSDGFVILSGKIILPRNPVIDKGRIRIQIQRARCLSKTFVLAPGFDQEMCIQVVSHCVVGIQFDSALELPFGSRPVPVIVMKYVAHRGMGFRKSII